MAGEIITFTRIHIPDKTERRRALNLLSRGTRQEVSLIGQGGFFLTKSQLELLQGSGIKAVELDSRGQPLPERIKFD